MSIQESHQLELLFKQSRSGLVYYCMKFVGNPEDANEIVNDVFVAIWKRKEHLVLDLSLKPYLYRSVHNKSLNFLAKRGITIQETEEVPDIAQEHADPCKSLEYKELQKQLNTLISELPPRCQQIFILSRKEGLSHKEISEIMNISTKTIENQITIALKYLKTNLL